MSAPTGTVYPGTLDTGSATIGTSVSSGQVIASTYADAGASAILAIETALGTNPQGSDSSVGVALTNRARKTDVQNQTLTYAADSGTANTYVVTLSPAPSALTAGMVVVFKAANANTGASTLNVNSLGAQSLVKNGSVTLVSGDINAGQIYQAVYDGTKWQLVGGGVGGTFTNTLLTGLAGGQTVIGGTNASNNLTLQSTTNATRGTIVLSDPVSGTGATFSTGTITANDPFLFSQTWNNANTTFNGLEVSINNLSSAAGSASFIVKDAGSGYGIFEVYAGGGGQFGTYGLPLTGGNNPYEFQQGWNNANTTFTLLNLNVGTPTCANGSTALLINQNGPAVAAIYYQGGCYFNTPNAFTSSNPPPSTYGTYSFMQTWNNSSQVFSGFDIMTQLTAQEAGSKLFRVCSYNSNAPENMFDVDADFHSTFSQYTPGTLVTRRQTIPSSGSNMLEEFQQNKVTTTNATSTVLDTVPGGGVAVYFVCVETTIVGLRTGGSSGSAGDGAAFILAGTFTDIGGSLTQIGSTTVIHTAQSQGTWTASLVASGDAVEIKVSGAANNNITWHSHTRCCYLNQSS